ncbi:carrier protein (macronuclear) [Tetrahymena thermophila SB210]|uniref:Carrier protein n=1 Tax=Tetrahymena thermophila (strain SB210) TaxID=312017 RepID=I7M8N5_TETTS|nr:carrier protein [Tetrahymena thermophila SB210]EAR99357.2 carrier protein [Tetrahymena thermophila SB210]|eukprot:XP_001019602.2 carrier protein [Tetrahymena thermophila SB210]
MEQSNQVNLRAAPVLNKNKETYFKKLIIHTILGGYLINDEESNIDLSFGFHLFQLLLYFMFPIIVFICGLMASSNSDYVVGGIIPGVINLVINLILQVISIIWQKKINENPLLVSESVKHYCTIVKHKSPLNLIYSVFIMGVLSFFASNFISKAGIAVQILTLITSLTSFYSLVSASPSEFSQISNNNIDLGRYSTAHMRSQYFLLLLIINFCLDTKSNNIVFSILIPLLPLLWALGCLSSLYVSFIYGVEKLNQYILGNSETTSSDLRLTISTAIQLIVILIISVIVANSYSKQHLLDRVKLSTLLSSILGFILSWNYLFKLGIASSTKSKESALYIWTFKVILLASSIIFPLVFSQTDDGKTICLISLIAFVINIISQYSQNAYIFERFTGITDKFNRLLCLVQQIIFTAAISQVSLSAAQTFSEYDFTQFDKNYIFIQVVLIYRLFHQIYTNPLMTGLMLSEIYIYSVARNEKPSLILIYSPLLYIGNYAISNFLKRILIWLYSIIKMNSSKKQRIQRLGLFNILSFTIFLPLNLISICVTSILDIPFLPFLGLPLYFIGFPRPKRFWPEVKQVIKNSGESLLYQKFLKNFQPSFSQILRKRNIQVGEFFLIRIEKYLATIQILENGQNYVVVQLRGLESQEMTSCHSIEANQIDRIIEETYVKKMCFFKDYLGSIKPVQQFKVKAYEENQLQFTGIITDSGFVQGFKDILLKMLVYFANQVIYMPEDEEIIDKLLQNYGDYVLHQNYHTEKFPNQFSTFIQFDPFSKKSMYSEAIKKLQQMKFKETAHFDNPKQANNGKSGFNLDEDLDGFFKSKKVVDVKPQANENKQTANKKSQEPVFNMPNDAKIKQNNNNNYNQNNVLNEDTWGKNNANKLGVQVNQNTNQQNPKNNININNNQQKPKNDLDDLLDDLSVKSNKQQNYEKKEIKAPINNPFQNYGKNQAVNYQAESQEKNIEMENNLAQSRHIKTPNDQFHQGFNNKQNSVNISGNNNLNNSSNKDYNQQGSQAHSQFVSNANSVIVNNPQIQLAALNNASRVTSQIQSNGRVASISTQNNNNSEFFQQIQAPILNSQQFNIQPKRENIATPPPQQQNQQQQNIQKQKINPIEEDDDDIDNYLKKMISEDDKKVNTYKEQQNQNMQNDKYYNNYDKNNNNNNSLLHQSMQQASDSKLKTQQNHNAQNVQRQLNLQGDDKDDIDNFLADLLEDKRPKAQAPPMMMLNLEDELNDSQNINQNQRLNTNQKNNIPGGSNSSQSNTRVSGERSPKDISNGNVSKQMEKIQKLVYLLFSLLTNDSNFDKTQIDQELLFKNFKDSHNIQQIRIFKNAPKNLDFTKIFLIMNKSIRYAIKIAYDTFAIMGSLDDIQNQDLLDSIKENDTDCQIGMGSDHDWSEAIEREVNSLWSLHFNHAERAVSIFRSHFKEINCNLFTLDENVVTSIWSNLVFELYYATNDDDERYSIQTHEQFFRNLIIQNSEEPLGYAPFYSGPTLIKY